MHVALYQVSSPDTEPREDRVSRVAEEVAHFRAADIIVLPELWTTGFFHFDRYRDEADPLEGRTTTVLSLAARASASWLIGGSFVEAGSDGHLYNTTVAFAPTGELVATYRKIHLFGYESAETRLLSPGQDVGMFDTDFGRVGMTTCYDLRFPEQYRLLIDEGVEMIFVCSAWPASRLEHWLLLNRARAVENLSFVFACNAVGEHGDVELAGNSLAIDPWGEVLTQGNTQEAWVVVDVDPGRVARVRSEFPALEDRLPGAPRSRRVHGEGAERAGETSL